MSDSLPQPNPDKAPPPEVSAQSAPPPPAQASADETAAEEIEVPDDPNAIAADRAGFKFLAIGFAIFFVIIAVCAGVVALVMKNMGI